MAVYTDINEIELSAFLRDYAIGDLRSYRGPNGPAMEDGMTPQSRIFGEEQLRWLKRELANSRALWKVIACDMPIGIVSRRG